MKDEIFGPVLCVGKFHTEEEAIKLANDTNYGLGAGLHSSTSLPCSIQSPSLSRYPVLVIVVDAMCHIATGRDDRPGIPSGTNYELHLHR